MKASYIALAVFLFSTSALSMNDLPLDKSCDLLFLLFCEENDIGKNSHGDTRNCSSTANSLPIKPAENESSFDNKQESQNQPKNRKRKKGATKELWQKNFRKFVNSFPTQLLLISFKNESNLKDEDKHLYVIEAQIYKLLDNDETAWALKRYIDNHAKNHKELFATISSSKDSEIWKSLGLESSKTLKKFRIIQAEAFNKGNLLSEYKAKGKLVSEVFKLHKKEFVKKDLNMELLSSLASEQHKAKKRKNK